MGRGRSPCAYSEAEARSLRLGLLLMGSGLVGLLLLGFCWLSPALRELQGRPANCTVLAVRLRPELFECTFSCGAACRGVSTYPCLQVFVNASQPGAPDAPQAPRLLHQDEQQLLANPKCSYIPPCERENQKNSEIVTHWQDYWEEEVGLQPFTCYFNPHLRPDDVLLRRTHDESVILHCFLWPMVTFLVGVLIVLLTICAKTLAVKAEAMKKRKHT